MNSQRIIFLNKVLVVIVCFLIIYAGIGVISFFSPTRQVSTRQASPHQEDKISGRSSPEITTMDEKGTTSPTPLPQRGKTLSHYEKVSSGWIFRSFISTPSPPPSSPSSPVVIEIQEEKPVVVEQEVTFQLVGITWGEGGANALIKSSQEPQTQLVTIGDKISGYQVVEITKEAIVLSKGNERKVVELEYLK